MIDHCTLLVSDYERSKAFYLKAIEPLRYVVVVSLTRQQIPDLPFAEACGLGAGGKPDLWLRPSPALLAPLEAVCHAPD